MRFSGMTLAAAMMIASVGTLLIYQAFLFPSATSRSVSSPVNHFEKPMERAEPVEVPDTAAAAAVSTSADDKSEAKEVRPSSSPAASPLAKSKPAPAKASGPTGRDLLSESASSSKGVAGNDATSVWGGKGPRDTKITCRMFGNWQDVCVYENTVCFRDHQNLELISESGRPGGTVNRPLWPKGEVDFTTKIFKNIDQDVERIRPAHYKLQSAKYLPPKEFDAMNKAGKVLWVPDDKVLHVPAYQESLTNIWFFSTRILPLWTSQFYADRLDIPALTAETAEVVLPANARRDKLGLDWHDAMFNLTLPMGTKLYYPDMKPYNGLTASESKKQLICAKKAVVYGGDVYAFPDFITARKFRQRAYDYVGVAMPQRPKMSITILDRKSYKPRHLANLNAVKDLCRKYGYEPEVVVWDHTTFEEQVKTLAATGVLLTVHGAGLMNEIFMPPGSSVIEIFPVHTKHVLYERIAHNMGIYHFKVYANEFAPGFNKKYSKYFEAGCHDEQTLSVPELGACWGYMKNPAVVAPMQDLEVALVNALDFISPKPVWQIGKEPAEATSV